MAWGDWDGDGDLDLAVGNWDQPNQVYENEGGTLSPTPAWKSGDDAKSTRSIAWGDWDGDGDLDLAVGNAGQANQVYENDKGALKLDWGNGFGWESTNDTKPTYSVAWGDWDGDGDLDLAAGNDGQVNQIYENQGGTLSATPVWESTGDMKSTSVAWGDWDGDGDLDLAVGNDGPVNQVYENTRQGSTRLANNPPSISIARPGVTDDAEFFSTPHIITQTNIPLTYTLFDPEGDLATLILPEFSPNGGGQWLPATVSSGTTTTDLSNGPHVFNWNAGADIVKSDNVVFRLRVQPSDNHSPILWPAFDAKSPPFRVEAPWFIRVVRQNNQPISGATVYSNGRLLGVTGQGGLLGSPPLETGTKLLALVKQAEQPTNRLAHSGWAYQTYITNVVVDAEGDTHFFIVDKPGEQSLTISHTNTLVLFNLVVSVEWDATEAYLQDVQKAIDKAADFLYDVTDGQMTFGQVAIYDNAEHWTETDIQISTKNVVRPHAYIGGIFDQDTAHLIRVGRFWDGYTANKGAWSKEEGFKTLVHEFGHYGLGLYDEYFGYDVVDDDLAGHHDAFCTGPENRNPDTEATNASIMDHQYTSSELADVSRWTDWCQRTAQHQLNKNEADWETLVQLYKDSPDQNRWQLVTPDQRAGAGQAVRGPSQVPTALPFPTVSVHNSGENPEPFSLQVCYNGALYREGAWVTLVRASGKAIDQGLTDRDKGELTILGARPVDSLQIVSMDRALSTSAQVAQVLADGYLNLTPPALTILSGKAGPPYLRLWPTTSNGDLDGLQLVVTRTRPSDNLRYVLTGSDDLGPSATIPYDPIAGDHRVQVGYIPAALAGYARVMGNHAGQYIELNVDYRLQRAANTTETNLFANDGNLKLHLDDGALPLDEMHFLIASPGSLPGPLPPGLNIVGEAYEITASNDVTGLVKPAVLRLHYDVVAGAEFENLAIYRWDFGAATWQSMGGEINSEHQEVVTTTTKLGLYALMGIPASTTSSSSDQSDPDDICTPGNNQKFYLPIILK